MKLLIALGVALVVYGILRKIDDKWVKRRGLKNNSPLFSPYFQLLLWKNFERRYEIMITFTILLFLVLAAIVIIACALGAGVLAILLAFGDIIVCGLIIYFIVKLSSK